jgi:hypothetical protein
VAANVIGLPGATTAESDERVTPTQPTLSRFEAIVGPSIGNLEVGEVMNAANVWMPDWAE